MVLNSIHQGDCIEVMKTFPANVVDTIITDPPYGLDFMGKDWDGDVPGVHFWDEMLRVCKPGALLLSFGGTRTWHHLATAIEKAGWEIRDCLMWLYGSGFPKSLDISKAIDKAKGAERTEGSRQWSGGQRSGGIIQDSADEVTNTRTIYDAPATDLAREWNGWGTALKPAWEPIIVAMKPLDGTFAENAEKWGVAGINVDGGRIGGGEPRKIDNYKSVGDHGCISRTGEGSHAGEKYDTRVTHQGRWPANLLLDEEAAAMLDGQSGEMVSRSGGRSTRGMDSTWSPSKGMNTPGRDVPRTGHSDSGGASRFFYVAKASRSERNKGCEALDKQTLATSTGQTRPNNPARLGADPYAVQSPVANHHPTVKPLKLMEYLCTLTKTPTGGIVLDPFAGSGSTLIAAERTGRPWIGIEMNPEYVAIANARIAANQAQMKMAI